MKRLLIASLLGLAALSLSPAASAHVDVSIGLGLPGIVVGPPVVYAPAQPYYAPPPVVYGGGGYYGRPGWHGHDDHRDHGHDNHGHDQNWHR